jgi:TP901 family phage tail tape measure protein
MLESLVIKLLGDGRHYEQMLKSAVGQTRQMAENVRRVGEALTRYVTVPLMAIAGLSVHAFADFNQAMTESTALIRLTQDEITALEKKALELGAILPMGPVAAAEAYYEMFSAGLDAQQSLASLEPLMRFAAAGAFNLATAVALLEGGMSALGLMSKETAVQVANMTRVSDVLVRASTLVSGSVSEFGRALTRDAGAVMKAFNIDVEAGVAVLAAYHRMQIRGAMGGNMYGRVIRLLTAAAGKNAEAWKKVGIAVFDAQGVLRSMPDILADFERVTKGMSDAARVQLLDKLGLKILSQKALTPLIGMSEAIRKYEKELRAAGGTTQEVSDRQLKSFSNQMKILRNQLEIVAIEIGGMLAPLIGQLAEGVKGLVAWWKALTPETKKFILVAAGIAAAVGPVLLVLGMLPMVVGAIAGGASLIAPLLPLIAGIAVAAAGFIAESGGVEQAWARIQAAAREFIDWVRPVWDATVAFFVAAWPHIVEGAVIAWQLIRRSFENGLEVVRFFLGAMLGDATMTWAEIRDAVVFALDVGSLAMENFGLVAQRVAVEVGQYFLDMADRVTFGMAGVVDSYTLKLGEQFQSVRDEFNAALEEMRRKRAAVAPEALKIAVAAGPAAEQLKKQAGALGGEMGEELKKGMAQAVSMPEAALFGSAEAESRWEAYLQKLSPAGAGAAGGGEDAGDIVDAIDNLTEVVKGRGEVGIDVEGADIAMNIF